MESEYEKEYQNTQLLINPIKGLQPKYTSEDMDRFLAWKEKKSNINDCDKYRKCIISLANFLYKIEINDRDKELLWKTLKNNRQMLESMDVSRKEFSKELFEMIYEALEYKDENNTDGSSDDT